MLYVLHVSKMLLIVVHVFVFWTHAEIPSFYKEIKDIKIRNNDLSLHYISHSKPWKSIHPFMVQPFFRFFSDQHSILWRSSGRISNRTSCNGLILSDKCFLLNGRFDFKVLRKVFSFFFHSAFRSNDWINYFFTHSIKLFG